MFGGADPDIPNLIPSDIIVRRNYMTKPVWWRSEKWTVKNVFELKNAQRVLIDGNVFENSWPNGQVGYVIVFQGLNDGGRCTWCTLKDITFINNIVRHGNGGIQAAGHVAYDGFIPGPASENLTVRNNLFYDIGGRWGSGGTLGRFIQVSAGYRNVVIDHNTAEVDGPTPVILASPISEGNYRQLPGFTFTNNLLRGNEYGLFGDTAGSGTAALNAYARGTYTFRHNVLASDHTPRAGGHYPSTTHLPDISSFSASFENRTARNYRLVSSSPYKNAATDGTDIGVDMDRLGAVVLNLVSEAEGLPKTPTNVRIVR